MEAKFKCSPRPLRIELRIQQTFWFIVPTILCADGRRAKGSKVTTRYNDEVVCPSFAHTACDSKVSIATLLFHAVKWILGKGQCSVCTKSKVCAVKVCDL